MRAQHGLDAYADTGALTLTKVDADGFFGTFDVTFGGDHVTGSFAAPVCDPAAVRRDWRALVVMSQAVVTQRCGPGEQPERADRGKLHGAEAAKKAS